MNFRNDHGTGMVPVGSRTSRRANFAEHEHEQEKEEY
jgi:hypothetical protein